MLSRSELVSIWQKALRRIMSKRNKPDFLFILDLTRKLLVCRGNWETFRWIFSKIFSYPSKNGKFW